MRRVNIKYNDTIQTKSFLNEKEFLKWIKGSGSIELNQAHKKVIKYVWNLNVGEKIEFFGWRFSIQSKARAGNHLVL
jgi:hypothetical protein